MIAPPRTAHLRALTAALLLAGAGPAGAGGFSALSDLASVTAASKKVKCPKSNAEPPGGPAPSLAQALAGLEAVLRDGASPEALRALDQSAEARDPGRAARLGVVALADQRPLATLGLWLRAQRAAPQEPGHLVNLAALANRLGKYPEALALATAAEALRRDPAAPPGFKGRAVLLNNKGQALVGVGRPRDAQPVLAEALRISPDLAEANTNMAYALGDQGQCDQAIRYLRAGATRQPMQDVVLPPGDTTPPGTTPPAPGAAASPARRPRGGSGGDDLAPLPAIYYLDLSKGTPGVLPAVELPGGPVGATASFQSLMGASSAATARMASLVQESGMAGDAAAARRSRWQKEGKKLTERRARYLLGVLQNHSSLSVRNARVEPQVATLLKAREDAVQELKREASSLALVEVEAARIKPLDEKLTRCNDERCREGVERQMDAVRCGIGQQWAGAVRPLADRYESAMRSLFRETYHRASAAAASFSDPVHQKFVLLKLEEYRAVATADLMGNLSEYSGGLSGRERSCTKAPAAAKAIRPAAAARQELCKKLGGAKATASFVEVLSVGVSCEEVEVGVSTPGFVKLFGQGSYDFDTGEITVFGGAAAELPFGTFKEEGKVGPYVTFDSHGNISDFGVRSETTHTVGVETGVLEFGVETPGLSGNVGAASSYRGLFDT